MPEAADELYGLDPAAFTAARDALAKTLRAGGDKAGADLVKRLRRPPVTVWALNMVARHDPSLLQEVIDAGAGLRAATERAVAGDASAMRAAKAAERSAIDAAVTAAERYLDNAGHPAGATARQRLEATLHAAEVDDSVAARLAAGTLDRDRDAPGLGLELSGWPDQSPPTAPGGRTTDDGAEAGSQAAGRRAPTEGAEAVSQAAGRPAPADDGEADAGRRRQARADVSDLEDQADRLGGRASRLAGEADAAERRAAEARAAADQAAAAANEARAAADQAAAAANEARAAADQAGSTAAAANEELARARAGLG